TIGEKVNVGAGTITCNYDGYKKFQTVIEDGAFVGSDTQLVAPVRVGKRAVIGAGTTVTRDVPAGALALSRSPQIEKLGYADKVAERYAGAGSSAGSASSVKKQAPSPPTAGKTAKSAKRPASRAKAVKAKGGRASKSAGGKKKKIAKSGRR